MKATTDTSIDLQLAQLYADVYQKGREYVSTAEGQVFRSIHILSVGIALDAFNGKVDKGGIPYFEHCRSVAINSGYYELGLLHDLAEDTPAENLSLYYELIRKHLSVGEALVSQIEVLTRKHKEPYEDYIDRIIASGKRPCVMVKIADLEHNMDTRRLNWSIGEKDLERLKRYHSAWLKLKKFATKQ